MFAWNHGCPIQVICLLYIIRHGCKQIYLYPKSFIANRMMNFAMALSWVPHMVSKKIPTYGNLGTHRSALTLLMLFLLKLQSENRMCPIIGESQRCIEVFTSSLRVDVFKRDSPLFQQNRDQLLGRRDLLRYKVVVILPNTEVAVVFFAEESLLFSVMSPPQRGHLPTTSYSEGKRTLAPSITR